MVDLETFFLELYEILFKSRLPWVMDVMFWAWLILKYISTNVSPIDPKKVKVRWLNYPWNFEFNAMLWGHCEFGGKHLTRSKKLEGLSYRFIRAIFTITVHLWTATVTRRERKVYWLAVIRHWLCANIYHMHAIGKIQIFNRVWIKTGYLTKLFSPNGQNGFSHCCSSRIYSPSPFSFFTL